MKPSALTAGLLALAFFVAPMSAHAAQTNEPGTMVVAQAGQNSKRIENIRKFLAGGRNLARLPDDRLRQRLQRAQTFQNTPNLPADLMAGLQQEEQQIQAEMSRRQSGGGNAASTKKDNAGQSGKQNQAGNQNQGGKQKQSQAQTSSGGGSNEIQSFIESAKPADQLNDRQLQQQVRQAAQLAKTQGISKQDRQRLRQIMRDGRTELANRKKGGQGQGSAGNGNQQGTGKKNQQGAADAGKSGAAMPDQGDASKLSDAELRKRLQDARERLSSDKLSPAEKKALRQQLAADRTVLRSRVGQKNETNITGDGNTVNNSNVTINNNTVINREVIQRVRNDRRPARDLKDSELRLRINVFSRIMVDASYSEGDRREWRGIVERDRAILRERLIAERRRRGDHLRVAVNNGNLKIRLGMTFQPDRPPPPRFIFAAEADEADLEDVLTAPPRRQISRRYSVEEVETNPDLRDAVARIEIDTINFGFGESFVPAEEVASLDKIAEIIEKILATNPNEVFMIEGHTDAVGSDAANLQLSRERAQAVKEALVTYYVIPPENLKTVGFGEKYLKIPTEDAEAENRRVSIARITPLVGELDN